MSSRCHCAADIIVNCIKPEMKSSWWKGLNIDALPLARQLWEQTHPNESQTETQIADWINEAKIES